MKLAGLSAIAVVASAAAVMAFLLFADDKPAPAGGEPQPASAASSIFEAPPPTSDGLAEALVPAAPARDPSLPFTWMDGLFMSHGGAPVLISCLDANHDQRIDVADGPRFAGVSIPLVASRACLDPAKHRDVYPGPPSDPYRYRCDVPKPPMVVVTIAGGGSEILDVSLSVSQGLIDVVNAIELRAKAAGFAVEPVLSTAAILGADMPQTRMEQWIAHDLAARLDALPCLRAVLIGHSHGGVTVTSVAALLDDRYARRVFGVLLDRTNTLYDRVATEMPARIPLLNVFQTNEGWHGVPLRLPNIEDADESSTRAPVTARDTREATAADMAAGSARVTHLTLDDSPEVQALIVNAIMRWADRGG